MALSGALRFAQIETTGEARNGDGKACRGPILRYVAHDDDLDSLDRDELVAEVKRLRAGIRAHRDSSGHDLCWHHPQLWGLLPEPLERNVAVPPWPLFLRGCVRYRESLDRELPEGPVHDQEFDP